MIAGIQKSLLYKYSIFSIFVNLFSGYFFNIPLENFFLCLIFTILFISINLKAVKNEKYA